MIKDDNKGTSVSIQVVPGKTAPRYVNGEQELRLGNVVITEKATINNLPLVDICLEDEHGKKYFVMVTGRIIIALAGAVKGINLRNHGVSEL